MLVCSRVQGLDFLVKGLRLCVEADFRAHIFSCFRVSGTATRVENVQGSGASFRALVFSSQFLFFEFGVQFSSLVWLVSYRCLGFRGCGLGFAVSA